MQSLRGVSHRAKGVCFRYLGLRSPSEVVGATVRALYATCSRAIAQGWHTVVGAALRGPPRSTLLSLLRRGSDVRATASSRRDLMADMLRTAAIPRAGVGRLLSGAQRSTTGALPPKLVHSVKVSFLDLAARNPPIRFPPSCCRSGYVNRRAKLTHLGVL